MCLQFDVKTRRIRRKLGKQVIGWKIVSRVYDENRKLYLSNMHYRRMTLLKVGVVKRESASNRIFFHSRWDYLTQRWIRYSYPEGIHVYVKKPDACFIRQHGYGFLLQVSYNESDVVATGIEGVVPYAKSVIVVSKIHISPAQYYTCLRRVRAVEHKDSKILFLKNSYVRAVKQPRNCYWYGKG